MWEFYFLLLLKVCKPAGLPSGGGRRGQWTGAGGAAAGAREHLRQARLRQRRFQVTLTCQSILL